MSGNPKFLIAEQGGVEFDFPTEYTPELRDLSDIDLSTAPTEGQVLGFDGTVWLPSNLHDELISVKCIPGTSCYQEAAVLVDTSVNFLKQEEC